MQETMVGDYKLLSEVGRGAQAQVYKAEYTGESKGRVAQGEIVALKVLHYGSESGSDQSFNNRAELLCSLDQANIVQYKDYFVSEIGFEESRCLVMEFLDGETLEDRLKRFNDGLPFEEVQDIYIQVMEGLVYAQSKGLTHRDLKPSNIFIGRDESVKLLDFDIAKQESIKSGMTTVWQGAYDYRAPDYITTRDFHGDEVSDVFSLGVCLYETIRGKTPFPSLGEQPEVGYMNRWRGEETVAPSFDHGCFKVLTPNIRTLLRKALNPVRKERYALFSTMLNDFQKVQRKAINGGEAIYELISFAGKGGFGEVYKAVRQDDGDEVAIKYLYAQAHSERFLKEARILKEVRNKYLVKVHEFIEIETMKDRKEFFIVMEFLKGMPGWSLRKRVSPKKGGLQVVDALKLFANYLDALQGLHDRGIIHRDIKPGNLYAPPDDAENARIFDLGIARDANATMTTGHVPGTLDYMAPEFALPNRNERGSPRTDIYAMGLSLYEALTGRMAFERLPMEQTAAFEKFMARANGLEKPALSYRIPPFNEHPELVRVIEKAISIKPEKRYRSASEMRLEINKILLDILQKDMNMYDIDIEDETVVLNKDMLTMADISDGEQASIGVKPEQSLQMVKDIQKAMSAVMAEEERRKKQKMMTIMGIAAGILLLVTCAVGFLVWKSMQPQLARRSMPHIIQKLSLYRTQSGYINDLKNALIKSSMWRKKDKAHENQWDNWHIELQGYARSIPINISNAFAHCIQHDDGVRASKWLEEWQTLSPFIDVMGMTESEYKDMYEFMRKKIMAHNRGFLLGRASTDAGAAMGMVKSDESSELRVDMRSRVELEKVKYLIRELAARRPVVQNNEKELQDWFRDRDSCEKDILRIVEITESPDERHERLAYIDDLLNSKSGGKVFGHEIARLLDALKDAREYFFLSIENRSEFAMTVSGTLMEKKLVDPEKSQFWMVKLTEENMLATITCSAEAKYEPHVREMTYVGGHGLEFAVTNFGLKRIQIDIDPGDFASPRVKIRYRLVTSTNWFHYNPSKNKLRLAPGKYNLVFYRPDWMPVTNNITILAGDKPKVLKAPDKFTPSRALELLTKVKDASEKEDYYALKKIFVQTEPGFQWGAYHRLFNTLRDDWRSNPKYDFMRTLDQAESQINNMMRWRYQVLDPEMPTFRSEGVGEPAQKPPHLDFDISMFTKEMEDRYPAIRRLKIWHKATEIENQGFDSTYVRRQLYYELQALASELRVTGKTDEARKCEWESEVLVDPDNMKPALTSMIQWIPDVHQWIMHRQFKSNAAQMDGLEHIETFIDEGGIINEYDVYLAMYISFYIMQDSLEIIRFKGHIPHEERKKIVKMERILAKVLKTLDDSSQNNTIRYLVDKANKYRQPESNVGLFIMKFLSIMPNLPKHKSIRQTADIWLNHPINQRRYSFGISKLSEKLDTILGCLQ